MVIEKGISGLSGHHYLMLNSMQTLTCVDALSESCKSAAREIIASGLAERPSYAYQGKTYGYADSIVKLSKEGEKLLSLIRGNSEIRSGLEKEAAQISIKAEKEVISMREKLYPNFQK